MFVFDQNKGIYAFFPPTILKWRIRVKEGAL